MLEKLIKFKNFKWVDIVNPTAEVVDAIIKEYNFHELDREAILEEDQTARIDTYPGYVFIVLHFPKYDTRSQRYLTNEFNIFLSKDYLITVRYYQSGTMDRLHDRFESEAPGTSGELLYEVIDHMIDKVFRTLDRFGRDLRTMEKWLFATGSRGGKNLIQGMMIKKRNIITLKHMVKPQIAAIKIIELRMKSIFGESLEVYFENLDDKIQKIAAEIELLHENIESMESTLKTLFDLETNSTIKYLTIFSAFMLPLTLITSFYGMNVEHVPFHDGVVFSSIIGLLVGLFGVLLYLRLKWHI